MSKIKDKITRIENSLRMNELPPKEQYFVIEGNPQERDMKQDKINNELVIKYGETAASKALFIHIRSTSELTDEATYEHA